MYVAYLIRTIPDDASEIRWPKELMHGKRVHAALREERKPLEFRTISARPRIKEDHHSSF